MKRLWLSVICLCSLVVSGQNKVPVKPLEKLKYVVSYSMVFNVSAAHICIEVTPSAEYPRAQRLFAEGRTTSFMDTFFKVRDTLISCHDSITFLPYEFSRKAHEGNYHKTFDYRFDYDRQKIHSTVNRVGRYVRRDTFALQSGTFDMLSMAWLARGFDYENYNKNDLIPIRVLIDDKIYDLHVRYLGIETVRLKRQKKDCHVISPLLVEGDVFQGGEGMKIWLSADDRRVPLKLEAKILVGSIKAVLDESNSLY